MLLGGILNALIMIGIALATLELRQIALRVIIVVLSSYVGARIIFETWLWVGPPDDQTSSWSFVFVNTWFLAGVVSGIAVLLIAASLRNRNVPRSGS